MKHVAAYALLVLGGNSDPSEADVKKVLTEAGATGDDAKITDLVAKMKGKAFHELVAEGSKQIGSAGPAAAGGAAAPAEAKKEEKVGGRNGFLDWAEFGSRSLGWTRRG